MRKNSSQIAFLALILVMFLIGCRSTLDAPAPSSDPQAAPISQSERNSAADESSETDRTLAEAEAAVATEDFDKAKGALLEFLKVSPEDRRAHHLLGRAFFELGQYADAKLQFEQAIALDDSDPMTHLWMGKVLAEEIERAMIFAKLPLAKRLLSGFQRAAELDPESVPAHNALARYHLEAPAMAGGSAESLQHHIDALYRLDAAAAHRLEARRHLRMGDPAAAERELELAVAASPEDGESYLDLGRLLLTQGRVDEAWPTLQKAVELDPGQHEAHFRLAEAALAQESAEQDVARNALERYLVRHPTHDLPSRVDAWLLLGQVEEEAGEVDTARRAYGRVLEENPGHPKARRALERLAGAGPRD